jgi:signal peptidase II
MNSSPVSPSHSSSATSPHRTMPTPVTTVTEGPRLKPALTVPTAGSRWGWFALITLATVGLDQWTKVLAVRNLPVEPWTYLNDTVRLQLAYNTGAFLGMAGTWSENARFWLLTVLNGIFLVGLAGVLVWHWRMPLGRFIAGVGILAGGIGNMIDRVTNDGKVTDFMNLGLGPVRTGIFNVADMAITGGALILAWYWMREEQAPADPMKNPA